MKELSRRSFWAVSAAVVAGVAISKVTPEVWLAAEPSEADDVNKAIEEFLRLHPMPVRTVSNDAIKELHAIRDQRFLVAVRR